MAGFAGSALGFVRLSAAALRAPPRSGYIQHSPGVAEEPPECRVGEGRASSEPPAVPKTCRARRLFSRPSRACPGAQTRWDTLRKRRQVSRAPYAAQRVQRLWVQDKRQLARQTYVAVPASLQQMPNARRWGEPSPRLTSRRDRLLPDEADGRPLGRSTPRPEHPTPGPAPLPPELTERALDPGGPRPGGPAALGASGPAAASRRRAGWSSAPTARLIWYTELYYNILNLLF